MRIEGDGSSRRLAVAQRIDAAAALIAPGFGPAGRAGASRDRAGADGGSIAIIERFVRETGGEPGVGYVRDMARAQHAEAGDGTACAVILAAAMVGRALEALRAGADPVRLTAGIEVARDGVLAEVQGRATALTAKAEIAAVVSAALSAPALGELVADAFDKAGKEGVITVEPPGQPGQPGLELALSEGLTVDAGYVAAGQEFADVNLREPLVLVIDDEIRDAAGFASVAGDAAGTGRPLVVFAAGVAADALGALAASGAVVVVPGPADQREAILGDIAAVTGAKVARGGDAGLGGARKVVVTRDRTLIVAGNGDRAVITERVREIRAEIEARSSYGEREQLVRRLERLAGGAATLEVGGVTETETARLVSEAERGLLIARLAIDHGILPGGGAALADAGQALSKLPRSVPGGRTGDGAAGARVVLDSLTAPMRQLAANAGVPGAAVDKSVRSRKDGTGFDQATGKTVPMRPRVVDALPVIQAAVANATALAIRVLLG